MDKRLPRLVIEVTEDFKEMIKKQAKRHNMSYRRYIYCIILPVIQEREKIYTGEK